MAMTNTYLETFHHGGPVPLDSLEVDIDGLEQCIEGHVADILVWIKEKAS